MKLEIDFFGRLSP